MQPSITIVTPSFNQAAYLEKTIQSVLAQRADIHEYFVLDGGSTDDSVEIINKYASQIDYWVSRPDGGQADAIRQGFERATGDVLAWLNSDDLLLPGAIQKPRSSRAIIAKRTRTGGCCDACGFPASDRVGSAGELPAFVNLAHFFVAISTSGLVAWIHIGNACSTRNFGAACSVTIVTGMCYRNMSPHGAIILRPRAAL